MPHIGLLFEIRKAETRPGEVVRVVGNCDAMGNWDPYDNKVGNALQLRTGAALYPGWAMYAPVWVELDASTCKSFEDFHNIGEGIDDIDEENCSSAEELVLRSHEHSVSASEAGSRMESPNPEGTGDACEPRKEVVVEYKYVKDRRNLGDCGPSIQWENSIANRRVTIPQEPGSIWIVSDWCFNHNEQPQRLRTTLAEVLQRRGDLDPEWTCNPKADAPENTGIDGEKDGDLSSPGGSSLSHHTTSTIMMLGR
mmetsp:Transcript_25967/g.60044  ORF Transcript_25967/g.60044 Transcript_25967/m.60044 type:complete len:253 (-) Transcript_25967:185-943(-)